MARRGLRKDRLLQSPACKPWGGVTSALLTTGSQALADRGSMGRSAIRGDQVTYLTSCSHRGPSARGKMPGSSRWTQPTVSAGGERLAGCPRPVPWQKGGPGDGAAGNTHVLLEESQTPPVSPPSCPCPGPGLDLRTHATSELQAQGWPLDPDQDPGRPPPSQRPRGDRPSSQRALRDVGTPCLAPQQLP